MISRTAAALALATCVASAACSRPASRPAAQGTLRIGVGNSAGGEVMSVLLDLVYAESLLAVDWQGRPAGRLAENWAWSDDGLSLRVTLRPGIKLHDGRILDSTFVTAAIDRARRRTLTNGFRYLTAVERPDATTIVFRMSRPDTFLIDALAVTLMTDGDVGTGPFKLISRRPTIESRRNTDYYRGTPGAERISFVPYDTQRAAWAALLRHDVDAVQEVSRDSVDFLQGATDIATYASIRPFYIPLVFNFRNPLLGQVEVRRAIVEAIDREEIVTSAMRGHAMVADDPIWPYNWAYSPAVRRRAFNPTAARMRLDNAGFPLKPGGPGRMDSRFALSCAFWDQGPQFERIALLLQRQLAAVGIDLVLEPLNQDQLIARVSSGKYDSFLMQMGSGRTFDLPYIRWHSPQPGGRGLLDTGYTGADATLDRLRVARGEAEIRAGLADLRQQFYDDVPAAFLAWPETTRAIRANFDVGERADPDVFTNLWLWRPAPPQRAAR